MTSLTANTKLDRDYQYFFAMIASAIKRTGYPHSEIADIITRMPDSLMAQLLVGMEGFKISKVYSGRVDDPENYVLDFHFRDPVNLLSPWMQVALTQNSVLSRRGGPALCYINGAAEENVVLKEPASQVLSEPNILLLQEAVQDYRGMTFPTFRKGRVLNIAPEVNPGPDYRIEQVPISTLPTLPMILTASADLYYKGILHLR